MPVLTEEEEADLVLTSAHSIVSAVIDVAGWIAPDSTTACAMTLIETAHGIMVAAAAASLKDPTKTLEDVIQRTSANMAVVAEHHFEKLSDKAEGQT